MPRCKWCHAKSDVYNRISIEASKYGLKHEKHRAHKIDINTPANANSWSGKYGVQTADYLKQILKPNEIEAVVAILQDGQGNDRRIIITIPSPKTHSEADLKMKASEAITKAFADTYGQG